MTDLKKILDAAGEDAETGPHVDQLATLVESQIGNVAGGGYSQYCAWHCKEMT